MARACKGKKGGNTKSDINFRTPTITVRVPARFKRQVQLYALYLEDLEYEPIEHIPNLLEDE